MGGNAKRSHLQQAPSRSRLIPPNGSKAASGSNEAWEPVADALAEYGFGVIKGWMHTGLTNHCFGGRRSFIRLAASSERSSTAAGATETVVRSDDAGNEAVGQLMPPPARCPPPPVCCARRLMAGRRQLVPDHSLTGSVVGF